MQKRVWTPIQIRYNLPIALTAIDSLGATHGISGRPITIDPLSDASLLQMQRWMAECTSNHKGTCQPDSEHTLPTRVIDVYGNSSHDAFLHISEGQKGRWLILSHVWGNKAGYVTDAKNLNAMKTSIPEDKLPKTFQNAIAVTRRLGFQYLWIDSLCILQGETEDWAAEVVHMHEYYKHSSLMIAADAANGDHCGFLQPRPPKYPSIVVPFNFEHKAENHSVFVQRQPPSRKDLWPLFTRGWTLQEDVLSPRTVHFQTHQMTWECQTHKFEELKPYKVDSLKRALLGSSPNSWLSTVGEFSNRDLTFKEDMLPALSAIAKEYQSTSQQTYKAGLWLEDMHRCLLWTPRWRGKRTRQPSWSWASLDVPRKSIRTPTFRVELIKHLPQRQSGKLAGEISEVIDCVVVPEDGDSYGRIQSGSLRMRGPWKEAAEWSGFTPYINPDNGDDGPRNSSLECRREFDPFGQNERSPGDPTQLVCTLDEDPTDFLESSEAVLQHLSLFQILNIRYPEGDVIIALILQSVREEEGTFRRRGIAQVPIVHGHAEVGWKTREVRII